MTPSFRSWGSCSNGESSWDALRRAGNPQGSTVSSEASGLSVARFEVKEFSLAVGLSNGCIGGRGEGGGWTILSVAVFVWVFKYLTKNGVTDPKATHSKNEAAS